MTDEPVFPPVPAPAAAEETAAPSMAAPVPVPESAPTVFPEIPRDSPNPNASPIAGPAAAPAPEGVPFLEPGPGRAPDAQFAASPALQPPFPSALPPSAPGPAAPAPAAALIETPARPSDVPVAGQPRRRDDRPRAPRGPRPDLIASSEPVYRESAGYRMRLEPADLTRLRELPGSKGKSDRELGETFFDGQTDRFTASLAEDVPAPADVRVVVDPYSRQAFLAVEKKIRSILSF